MKVPGKTPALVKPQTSYRAIVVGASAGGFAALKSVLPALPAGYPLPVIVVQHLHPWQDGAALLYAAGCCPLQVKEAEEKEPIQAGTIYFAPPNYHLLIEDDETFALSIDEKVNYTRPSIDVLFESAAAVYGAQLVGVILSGGNQDGAAGLWAIKQHGGLAIVQDPACAEVVIMPRAAISATQVDYVLPLEQIGQVLCKLAAEVAQE